MECAGVDPRALGLMAVVLLAFTVESTLGFGATLVTLGLGAVFAPLATILPAFVPVSLLLSSVLVARHHRLVDRRFLFLRLVPFMALGLPFGVLAFRRLPPVLLERSFAAFVLALAGVELVRLLRAPVSPRPAPVWVERALLVLGGAIHGTFATGGPMAVYVSGRALEGKGSFRATLSALWVVLNALLFASYLQAGSIDAGSVRLSLMLLPPLLIGLVAGEKLHGHVPERAFRVLVLVVLVLAGLRLLLQAG